MGKIIVALLVPLLLIVPFQAQGAEQGVAPAKKSSGYSRSVFKGEVLSREIARTTGLALNPLLCMSALGAYTWYATEKSQRPQLPWHNSPRFWGPLGLLLLLILIKDSSKAIIPKVLIAPLDAVEMLLEKKATALLALPMLFSAVQSGEFAGTKQVSLYLETILLPQALAGPVSPMGLQAGSGLLTDIAAFCLLATLFVVVWILSHAFNMLILLCPFGFFDTILATTRNTLAAAVMGLANTFFGCVLSLAVIGTAIWLFPRALRLVIFGTVISYDLVVYRLFRKKISLPDEIEVVRGFTCCSLGAVPARTYGSISQKQGQLVFSCKPGIFKKRQRVLTGISSSSCELVPGILSPVVQRDDVHVFRIRPAYHDHVEQVGQALGMLVARETSLAGRVKDIFKWVVALFRAPTRLEIPPAP